MKKDRLFGNLGQQLDSLYQKKDLARLKADQNNKGKIEERISQLEIENNELRTHLAALIHLLSSKNICTQEEIKTVAQHLNGSLVVTD